MAAAIENNGELQTTLDTRPVGQVIARHLRIRRDAGLVEHGAYKIRPRARVGNQAGELVDRVSVVTRRVALDSTVVPGDAELEQAAAELAALEIEVSATRRAMFDRIDTIEAELTRRYRDGEASVDDLLVGDDRSEG